MTLQLSLLLFLVYIAVQSASAQWLRYPTPGTPRIKDGKPDLSAPAPTAPNGKPDLTGLWRSLPGRTAPPDPEIEDPVYYLSEGAQIPPLRPAYQAIYQRRLAAGSADRPSLHCLPHGIPDEMLVPFPFKLVQTSDVTFILYETWNHYRQIFTDGRKLPQDPNPSWWGNSIGHWEGDVFFVETTGFHDRSWLDRTGRPHSESLRTIERFRRSDFGHMTVEVTIDDPVAYTAAWTILIQFELLADTDLIEFMCDNETDAVHILGK
jgi:hypothetical protein